MGERKAKGISTEFEGSTGVWYVMGMRMLCGSCAAGEHSRAHSPPSVLYLFFSQTGSLPPGAWKQVAYSERRGLGCDGRHCDLLQVRLTHRSTAATSSGLLAPISRPNTVSMNVSEEVLLQYLQDVRHLT